MNVAYVLKKCQHKKFQSENTKKLLSKMHSIQLIHRKYILTYEDCLNGFSFLNRETIIRTKQKCLIQQNTITRAQVHRANFIKTCDHQLGRAFM